MLNKDWNQFRYSGTHPRTCTCAECVRRNIADDSEPSKTNFKLSDEDLYEYMPREHKRAYKKALKQRRRDEARQRKLASPKKPRFSILEWFRQGEKVNQ